MTRGEHLPLNAKVKASLFPEDKSLWRWLMTSTFKTYDITICRLWPLHSCIWLNNVLFRELFVLVYLLVCLQPTCVFNSGGEYCWGFAQQGKMAPIILTVTAPRVCVSVSPLDAFCQESLLMLETEPHQATARTSDHFEWYRSLSSSCFRARTRITLSLALFGWLISHAFKSHKKQHNYRHTEKSLCQTASCTVAFSPVPPLNLSLASSHCC